MFSYLQVKIDPYYDLEEKEFNVRACFLAEYKSNTVQEDYKPLPNSNKRFKSGELEQELNRLIRECMKLINRKNVLVVELFLRFVDLNSSDCDMHHWKVNKTFGSSAMSLEYPLLVRSLDRADCDDDEMVMYDWHHNWEKLKEQKTIVQPRFLSREQFEKDISLKDDMCLAFTVIPPPIEVPRKLPPGHIFSRMMGDGTSIALWPRPDSSLDGTDETQIREAYLTILSGYDFSELPEKIWEQRRRTSSQADLLVHCLTLFWDDPNCVPPDTAFEVPKR